MVVLLYLPSFFSSLFLPHLYFERLRLPEVHYLSRVKGLGRFVGCFFLIPVSIMRHTEGGNTKFLFFHWGKLSPCSYWKCNPPVRGRLVKGQKVTPSCFVLLLYLVRRSFINCSQFDFFNCINIMMLSFRYVCSRFLG